MPILKSSSKSKGVEGKLVGIVFPKELHSYFSLFVLAKGLTKSSIVKQQMENWRDLVQYAVFGKEEILLSEIILKVKNEWDLLKNGKSWPDFKKELKNELQKKGICDEHVKIILKNI